MIVFWSVRVNRDLRIVIHKTASSLLLVYVAHHDDAYTWAERRRIEEHPGAVAYGKEFPEFRVQVPVDGKVNGRPVTIGNGFQVSFIADSLDAVNAFHAAALEAGAVSEGEPGRKPHYGPAYYGCFVRDPDGHKIEAMYWDATAGLEAESHALF